MNMYDSELVAGILTNEGMNTTNYINDADVILINTCSVRAHAEERALSHVMQLTHLKKKRPGLKIGLLGCMTRRPGSRLLEDYPGIDFVVGPEGYRLLPALLRDEPLQGDPLKVGYEDYENIIPLRKTSLSAYVAISRGCNEECTYCIVPYTRGGERSRSSAEIIKEVEQLLKQGFKEITLLGQNVNSYRDSSLNFAALLDRISRMDSNLRIRFATSHPMNISEGIFEIMAQRENICKHLHLPVQSGSARILELMKRRYTHQQYLSIVEKARSLMPEIAITTDIISGFPTETEEDHEATVQLVREIQFENAFTFKYSPREGTEAFSLVDDVPEDVKVRRLEAVSHLVRDSMVERNQSMIGQVVSVLVEKTSRRSDEMMVGRTGTNKKVLISSDFVEPGFTVNVLITGCTSQSLFGAIYTPEKAHALA